VSETRRTFVKTATPRTRLDAEADGLAALRPTGTVRVPETLAQGERGLTLEWVDLRPLDARSGAALGSALAALHHAAAGERFGWHRDNFIGPTPQRNAWCTEWAEFFRERRLRPQFELAAANGHGGALQRDGDRLLDRVDALLAGHDPAASLLHGDLWGGNAGALPDGTPVIFDPAVYIGDRESDVAMTELFGRLPESFYAAYRDAYPLDHDYALRRELYNLYHLLNHLNLFGEAYRVRCGRAVASLLAQTR
jgi:fructosamine-3-kinase